MIHLPPTNGRAYSPYRMSLPLLVVLASAILVLASVAPASAAESPGPWWRVGSEVVPSNLPPEHEGPPGAEGRGAIIAVATNLGAGPVDGGEGDQVLITDKLPAGLTATEITGSIKGVSCALATLQCTFTGTLYPYQRLAIAIKVKVNEPAGTVTTLQNQVSVEGGGAPRGASSTQQLRISGAPTPFGVQEQGYELAPYNSDGTPATLAGSHPFQLIGQI